MFFKKNEQNIDPMKNRYSSFHFFQNGIFSKKLKEFTFLKPLYLIKKNYFVNSSIFFHSILV